MSRKLTRADRFRKYPLKCVANLPRFQNFWGAKLATKPLPTGSETVAKMTGILLVCCRTDAVVGVFCERRREGCSATSSRANRCIDVTSGVAQRISTWTLRPSSHPSFRRPSRNAATRACPSGSLSGYAISTPIRCTRSVRLLRARRERPTGRHASEQRDELASPHWFASADERTLLHR